MGVSSRAALAFPYPARRMATMKALRSPSMSGGDTDRGMLRSAALFLLSLLVMSLPVAAKESEAAVWKAREIVFSYRSSIAIYSCSGLQARVASILRAIGARDDLDVRVSNCDVAVFPTQESRFPTQEPSGAGRSPFDRLADPRTGREQLANVRVRLMMPTVVTPEVLAEIDKDKSRRELVSRVTGNPAAKLNDPIVFPASWQSVTLSRDSIGIEPEECELLEQMSTGVFRQLGVRVIRGGANCDRRSVSRISPKLTVKAFVGVPFGTSAVPQVPAAGESDPDPSTPAAADAEPSEPATATPQK
jgi:hypothetical protein